MDTSGDNKVGWAEWNAQVASNNAKRANWNMNDATKNREWATMSGDKTYITKEDMWNHITKNGTDCGMDNK